MTQTLIVAGYSKEGAPMGMILLVLLFALQLSEGAIARQATHLDQSLLKPYTATYEGYYGTKHIGSAKRTLKQDSAGHYQLQFSSHAAYLLMEDKRQQRSKFLIDNNKVRFFDYFLSEKRPFKSTRESFIRIDWNQNHGKEIGQYKEKPWQQAHNSIVYDRLTHLLQLRADLLSSGGIKTYDVTHKGQVKTYRYKTLHTNQSLRLFDHTFKTRLIQRVRNNSKRETLLWLDENNAYFPVRIMQKKEGKVQLDLKLRQLEQHE